MDLKEENGQPNFTGDLVSAVVDDAPRPFDVICDGLTAMGGLAIDDFLNTNSSSSAVFDVNFYLQLPEILSSFEKDKEKSVSDEAKTGGSMTTDGKPSRNAVALLRQTCESVLGSFEALSYDYLESNPKSGFFFAMILFLPSCLMNTIIHQIGSVSLLSPVLMVAPGHTSLRQVPCVEQKRKPVLRRSP